MYSRTCVVLDKSFGAPTITHDGVTVAKEIELDDHFQNMGAQMLKEAATRTNDVAGDGTTTATVLAQAMVTEGLRNVAAGANPMLLERGIDLGTQAVVDEIRKRSIPVKGSHDIEHIAAIAANDTEIGQLLAQAMDKVGQDGVITIEEGKSLKVEVEYTEGMQFDRGYISPYFVSDLQRMEASLDEPYVLITDKKVSGTTDLCQSWRSWSGWPPGSGDHRRGRRRRSAGNASGQQAPRHPERGGS